MCLPSVIKATCGWVRVRLEIYPKSDAVDTADPNEGDHRLLPAAPTVRSERYVIGSLNHRAANACPGVVESISESMSTGFPLASVIAAWLSTTASALPRRTSA